VLKEIRKCRLSIEEQAKVQVAMDRVAEGRAQPKDVKTLRDGVLEVRVRVGQRQLRLLYAEVSDGPILLALHFFQKQRQVETRHIDLASGRLRDWEARPG
jgi:phage-related protein